MNEQDEIDLLELGFALLDKWLLILFSTVLGGAIALLITITLITPQYKSSISFYVNNSSVSIGNTKVSITSGDISAAQDLVSTYIVILNTRDTMNEIIKDAKVDLTFEQISSMVTANSVNSTEIFKVTVESPDPYQAQTIANSIGRILPSKITSIIDGCSARIVDRPIVPDNYSSPDIKKNTLIGAAAGFILTCAIIVIAHLTDDVIRSEEDLAGAFALPILASIPNLENKSSNSDAYVYGNYGDQPDKDILEILGYGDKKEGGMR